jgi:glycine/D-amino acid oxidase-like deaminating enzyme
LPPPRAQRAASASSSPYPKTSALAQYGHEIYGNFETLMAVNGDRAPIDFHREGYLWLGSGKRDVDSLIANWRIQTAHDARLDRKGVKHRFPSMRVDDLDIAAFSADDGYMDPHSVLMGFRRKAASLGIRYRKDRVVDFDVAGKRVAHAARQYRFHRLPRLIEPGHRTDGNRNARICIHGPGLKDAIRGRLPAAPSPADRAAGTYQARGNSRIYR